LYEPNSPDRRGIPNVFTFKAGGFQTNIGFYMRKEEAPLVKKRGPYRWRDKMLSDKESGFIYYYKLYDYFGSREDVF
jgi:hypothetical protein